MADDIRLVYTFRIVAISQGLWLWANHLDAATEAQLLYPESRTCTTENELTALGCSANGGGFRASWSGTPPTDFTDLCSHVQ
jgi:hypothetical protein